MWSEEDCKHGTRDVVREGGLETRHERCGQRRRIGNTAREMWSEKEDWKHGTRDVVREKGLGTRHERCGQRRRIGNTAREMWSEKEDWKHGTRDVVREKGLQTRHKRGGERRRIGNTAREMWSEKEDWKHGTRDVVREGGLETRHERCDRSDEERGLGTRRERRVRESRFGTRRESGDKRKSTANTKSAPIALPVTLNLDRFQIERIRFTTTSSPRLNSLETIVAINRQGGIDFTAELRRRAQVGELGDIGLTGVRLSTQT
ncbi:hypothetical protein RRG08_031684 [Elysia crispata]|uniref:Uncharacterized protein n=1 Tax=Elysia crispata TaxID=231223 RepID=A0AAE1AA75_9GAST|nr:hypothetical protein RRG08_031684 [Elysia crispata]